MNPDLEFFLESIFDSIEPATPEIGRVVVEPEYDANPCEDDRQALREELLQCIRDEAPAPEISPATKYPVLSRYVRRLSMRADRLPGPWIEVAPPGNWI